jgi:carbon storage regulator
MLVLARKIGEQVVVNNNIIITILEIDRGKCRIGFEAPEEVTILRKELHDRFHDTDQKPIS